MSVDPPISQRIIREHAEKLATRCDQMLRVLRFFTLHGTASYSRGDFTRVVSERVGEPIDAALIVDAMNSITASIDAEAAKLSEEITLQ